jgi:hypothetical protein
VRRPTFECLANLPALEEHDVSVIDLNEPGSWPPAVMAFASAHAERLQDSTEITSDLARPLDSEDE